MKDKIKIKPKPRPIENEIKDLSDAKTNIVIRMEMYEEKEEKKFGATCATSLRLTKAIHGTGRDLITDSWFGSVKTAVTLHNVGVHSIMVVRTAPIS